MSPFCADIDDAVNQIALHDPSIRIIAMARSGVNSPAKPDGAFQPFRNFLVPGSAGRWFAFCGERGKLHVVECEERSKWALKGRL